MRRILSRSRDPALLPALGLPLPAAALVALCRRGGGDAPGLRAAPEFRHAGFHAALAALAHRHGVFGLVLLEFARADLLPRLPPESAEYAGRSLRQLRRQAALWDLERELVTSLFAERNLPAILLKGAALRITSYADSVQRPFGDLDVLVPDERVEEAVAILTARGYRADSEDRARLYRQHHHHLILRKEMGFIVEIHWALEPMRSPFRLDPEAFRNAARLMAARKGRALVPSPEHLALHLSVQNVEDGYSRLGRIVDLDRLIAGAGKAFDWNSLADDAIRMRGQGALALSLRLSELLLATPVPRGFIAELGLSAWSRAHLAVLDPVGLLLEQRAQKRTALERLTLLWNIPDLPARRGVRRAICRGVYDRITSSLLAGVPDPTREPAALTSLKLSLYQLWLFWRAIVSRLRGSRRVLGFWSLRLNSPA